MTALHKSLHVHSGDPSLEWSWESEKFLMESRITSSHLPQLWAPLPFPPPVGSHTTFASRPLVVLSTSSTLQSHGGLYDQFFQSLSTSVPFWTLTGLREIVALTSEACRIVATASLTASASVRNGGLSSTYVLMSTFFCLSSEDALS